LIVGTGVDIVEVARFQRFVDERNEALLDRLFTPAEREYCRPRRACAQHYAARFAAKEAFVKALGMGIREGIGWQDVEVTHDGLDKPLFRFTPVAQERLRERHVVRSHLSLSHDGGMALAMVILES
jgi:holo-[acyl-carrier protein] synthase